MKLGIGRDAEMGNLPNTLEFQMFALRKRGNNLVLAEIRNAAKMTHCRSLRLNAYDAVPSGDGPPSVWGGSACDCTSD